MTSPVQIAHADQTTAGTATIKRLHDVDFPFFPSACAEMLPRRDARRVIETFRRGRSATGLWLQLRRTIEDRHGPGPRHPHAFLDTLVAPCATVDAALARLRGAQAEFLLDGILLEIDPDAFAIDHARHAGARATQRPRASCEASWSRTSPLSARWRAQPARTRSRSSR